MTASQHTPRQATTTATSGLARRRLASGRHRQWKRSVGEAAYARRVLAAVWVPDPLTAHCSGRQLGLCPCHLTRMSCCPSTCARQSEIVRNAEPTAHTKPLSSRSAAPPRASYLQQRAPDRPRDSVTRGAPRSAGVAAGGPPELPRERASRWLIPRLSRWTRGSLGSGQPRAIALA